MSKQKNLTLSTLKKLDSQFNGKKRVFIDDDYYLDVDTSFRNTKIQLILERIIEVNQYIAKEEIEKFDMVSYSLFLAIKHFTTLQVEDELSTELKALEILIDLDYLTKILESFGEENLKMFLDKLTQKLNNFSIIQNQLLKEILKEQGQSQSEVVEDSDVGNKLEGDKNSLVGTAITSDTSKDSEKD